MLLDVYNRENTLKILRGMHKDPPAVAAVPADKGRKGKGKKGKNKDL